MENLLLPILPLPTPVKVNRLEVLLEGYDCHKQAFLIDGFKYGFHLFSVGQSRSYESPNLLSATQQPQVVDQKVAKELEAHRFAGPFDSPPFPVFRVSPLGIVPKKIPGEFRMIHHLSYPRGESVNDGISHEHSSVQYANVDKAIKLITQTGVGSYLAKTDIKSAFRILPVNPQDYHLLGIKWNGQYYFDKCIPMGCSSSCKTFETFSTAIEWIAKDKLCIANLIHLLDDFLLIQPTASQCSVSLRLFLDLCDFLGIPMAPEKTFGPSTILTFAGVELDTIRCESRLPVDKLVRCSQLIASFLKKKKATLRELQQLTGVLNFACSVVVPGRAFLRRLIDLTIGLKRPSHFVRISKEVKADLLLWQQFFQEYNGKSFFLHDKWENSVSLQLFTDAAGAYGFGAVFGAQWCYGEWPREWKGQNIAILEFYPIVLSLLLWGDKIRDKCLTIFTDNEALVHVINKSTCKDTTLMIFVRKLVLVCLRQNILFKAKHISGFKNSLADALSRLQIPRFKKLAPAYMDPMPTVIPPHLLPVHWPL